MVESNMTPSFTFDSVGAREVVLVRNGFGPYVVFNIDLTGFDTLDGRDMGVGTLLVSPSAYTGGSWYSAWAEKPTLFLLDVEPPDAGEWALGGVWRLEAGG
jgi:hypothetical protein